MCWAMGKLGVEEWFVKVVQTMYTNARSHVKVNGTLSEEFIVNVIVTVLYCLLWYLKHCRVNSDQGVHRNYYTLMILC